MQDQSIGDQKKAITQFAQKNGMTILRWYEDEDSSGTSIVRRKGFQTLKSQIEQNRHDFSKILIYDVTRWGRFPDPRESIYWEMYFEKRGVSVIYVSENFKSDRSFETAIVKTVKHAAAGDFSRRLSLLTTRGSRTTAERGLWNGSGAPYGYKRAEVDSEKNMVRILEEGEKCRPDYKVMLVKGDPEEVQVVQTVSTQGPGEVLQATGRLMGAPDQRGRMGNLPDMEDSHQPSLHRNPGLGQAQRWCLLPGGKHVGRRQQHPHHAR
jgi:DNA invertase Pin-like site-specific DNA recombinase